MITELLVARTPITAETLTQYVQSLKEKGILSLGKGMSATVFNHPTMPNVVVKMIVADDPYYLKYVNFCKKNPNNPWLPRILGGPEVRTLVSKSKVRNKADSPLKRKVIFLFLEKLRPANRNDTKAACEYAASLLENNVRYYGFDEFSPGDWQLLSKQTKDRDFATLASFLYTFDNYLDLHSTNFMMRGAQLVFNDPVSPGTYEHMLAKAK